MDREYPDVNPGLFLENAEQQIGPLVEPLDVIDHIRLVPGTQRRIHHMGRLGIQEPSRPAIRRILDFQRANEEFFAVNPDVLSGNFPAVGRLPDRWISRRAAGADLAHCICEALTLRDQDIHLPHSCGDFLAALVLARHDSLVTGVGRARPGRNRRAMARASPRV